jgi:transposase
MNDRDKLILQARREGMTLREIAADFGVSFQRVAKIVNHLRKLNKCRTCGKAFEPQENARRPRHKCLRCHKKTSAAGLAMGLVMG